MDSFNLNAHPPSETTTLESDPHHQGENLVEVMTRIQTDNINIINSLGELFDKYESIHNQLIRFMKITSRTNTNYEDDAGDVVGEDEHNRLQKKRKAADDLSHANSSSVHSEEVCCRRARLINYKPKISTAFIRIHQSDTTLVVKDGYQWRKYGQKVTRDNPSPRAYFKCSFAPLCPVKKKVQRSVEDPTTLVVTYEGEHTHKKPPSGATLCPLSTDGVVIEKEDEASAGMLVERMASSLTKDPSFTSALATAIYSKLLQHT